MKLNMWEKLNEDVNPDLPKDFFKILYKVKNSQGEIIKLDKDKLKQIFVNLKINDELKVKILYMKINMRILYLIFLFLNILICI